MKKNSVTIIILLAAAGLGYYLYIKRRKPATTSTTKPTTTTGTSGAVSPNINQGSAGLSTPGAGTINTGSSGTTAGKYNFSDAELTTLLNRGKTGTTVKALQIYLNKSGANLSTDGNFGPLTETALRNEENINSITLKSLNITGVNTSTNNVYGKQFGWSEEGIWNGVSFV